MPRISSRGWAWRNTGLEAALCLGNLSDSRDSLLGSFAPPIERNPKFAESGLLEPLRWLAVVREIGVSFEKRLHLGPIVEERRSR